MRICLIISFFYLLSACKNHTDIKLLIPTKLSVLTNSDQKESIQNNKKLKLVHYFNASCSSCIHDIGEWKKVLDSLNQKDSIDILFIGFTEDPMVSRFYLKKLSFPHKIYFDSSKVFLSSNKLSEANYTFLTDDKNKVLCQGNPLQDSETMLLYIKYINNP